MRTSDEVVLERAVHPPRERESHDLWRLRRVFFLLTPPSSAPRRCSSTITVGFIMPLRFPGWTFTWRFGWASRGLTDGCGASIGSSIGHLLWVVVVAHRNASRVVAVVVGRSAVVSSVITVVPATVLRRLWSPPHDLPRGMACW